MFKHLIINKILIYFFSSTYEPFFTSKILFLQGIFRVGFQTFVSAYRYAYVRMKISKMQNYNYSRSIAYKLASATSLEQNSQNIIA